MRSHLRHVRSAALSGLSGAGFFAFVAISLSSQYQVAVAIKGLLLGSAVRNLGRKISDGLSRTNSAVLRLVEGGNTLYAPPDKIKVRLGPAFGSQIKGVNF